MTLTLNRSKITVERKRRKQIIAIDGVPVATLHNDEAAERFRSTLADNISRIEAVYDAFALLGDARVRDVARMLDMNTSNTSRYVNLLVRDGRLTAVAVYRDGRGRPAQVYRVTPQP